MLQALLANVNRGKGQKAYQPAAFLPKWGVAAPDAGPMTGEEMLAQVKKLNKRMGGRQGGDAS